MEKKESWIHKYPILTLIIIIFGLFLLYQIKKTVEIKVYGEELKRLENIYGELPFEEESPKSTKTPSTTSTQTEI